MYIKLDAYSTPSICRQKITHGRNVSGMLYSTVFTDLISR